MTIPLEELFAAFGLPATVTSPRAERAVETTIIWLPPDVVSPSERDRESIFARSQTIREMVLRRSEVTDIPIVPNQTVIQAPELPDGDEEEWMVESVTRTEADMIRVIVAPVEDGCG